MFIILKTDYDCGFPTKVTLALLFILQEYIKELLELNTFKHRKTTISSSVSDKGFKVVSRVLPSLHRGTHKISLKYIF